MQTPRWYWAFLMANLVIGAAGPLFPLFIYQLGGGPEDVGKLASIASFVGVIGSLFWGKLSDLTGRRRPFVVLSFAALALGYAIVPLATSTTYLIILNAAINLFWVANAAVVVLLIMEIFQEADWEREIGQFNVFTGIGWTGGLGLGAAWTTMMLPLVGEGWGLRSLGALIALLAAVATFFSVRWLQEPRARMSERPFIGMWAALGNLFQAQFRSSPTHIYHLFSPRLILKFLQGHTAFGPDLILCYYGTFLTSLGFAIFFVPLPLFLRADLGWQSGLVYAGFYFVHHLVIVFAFSWARRAVVHWRHRPTLAFALMLRTIGFALFAAVGKFLPGWAVPVLALATGASWAFYQLALTAVVSRLAPQGLRGQALGIFNALSGLGGMLGSLVGGFLAAFLGFTASALAAAALVFMTMPILLVEGRSVHPGGSG